MAKVFSKKQTELFASPQRMAQLGQQVTERLNAHPRVQWLESPFVQLYVHQNFLSDADCALLIDMIESNSQPSTLYKGSERNGYRTSYSCNVDPANPDIQRIDKSICDLLGLPQSHSEILQGQRYREGQQFKDHHDYFHQSESYWQYEGPHGGQRSWTAMVYLNEPEKGGATAFPQLQYEVEPRRGMALIWNNMKPDGTPNIQTLHAGTPVEQGTKYIITKWFRLNRWGGS